ncbi:MAG: photosystem I reaction center protein subunit XI [Synechococcaceae cyanobacterium RL_1_2]|nr:photosystem I reaction center protein subunit XI [Synechococcaceae cyanobacterium RL_1_2]
MPYSNVVTDGGNREVGNLSTPINGSPVSLAFLRNLPAYRHGLSPNRRGLEIGMAHGYFIYGPFALLGPLRDSTGFGPISGLLASIGLVSILTIALSLYSATGVSRPTETFTTPNPPSELGSTEGWSEFASGFFLGGTGGAIFAYFLCTTPYVEPLVKIASGIWSS